MTKLAPEWVRTSDPVIRSPARYRWTTAPAWVVGRKKGCSPIDPLLLLPPGQNADLTEYIAACRTCRNYETASPKETLRPHEVTMAEDWDRSDDAAWTRLPCHSRLLLWILGTGQTSRHLVKGCDPQNQSTFRTIGMPRTGGR